MALGHGASIVRDGLVLHLDAANPKSYPGTGTIWKDLSGNGNDGTLVNSVEYDSANNGSMVFDGVDNYGYVEETSALKPLNEISVSIYCRSINLSYSNVRVLGDWHQTRSYDRWIFYINGSSIQWYMDVSGTSNGGPSGWPIETNIWVNLVGVYDGSVQRLYVNGLLFSSRTATGTMNSGDGNRPIRFGGQGFYAGTASSGATLNGDISDIKVYNRALSAAEIKQNFEVLRGRYGI